MKYSNTMTLPASEKKNTHLPNENYYLRSMFIFLRIILDLPIACATCFDTFIWVRLFIIFIYGFLLLLISITRMLM